MRIGDQHPRAPGGKGGWELGEGQVRARLTLALGSNRARTAAPPTGGGPVPLHGDGGIVWDDAASGAGGHIPGACKPSLRQTPNHRGGKAGHERTLVLGHAHSGPSQCRETGISANAHPLLALTLRASAAPIPTAGACWAGYVERSCCAHPPRWKGRAHASRRQPPRRHASHACRPAERVEARRPSAAQARSARVSACNMVRPPVLRYAGRSGRRSDVHDL